MNETKEELDYACFSFHADVLLAAVMYLYISLILVVLGLAGNFINILVTVNYLSTCVSSIYIFLLALSDSAYLTSVFLAKLLVGLRCLYFKDSTIDFVNQSDICCKLLHYIIDLFSNYSTMLILCFTVERFIAVYHPMRVKQICTLKRTKLFCLALFITLSVVVAPHHFLMIGLHHQFPVCIILVEWEREYSIVYILELVLLRVAPVFAISVLNIAIICKVLGNKKVGESHNRKDHNTQMTIILILISTSYILLYLPVIIHFVLWWLLRKDILSLSERGMEIGQKCTNTLYICGFAINFYLYTIGSKLFRNRLRKLLCFVNGATHN